MKNYGVAVFNPAQFCRDCLRNSNLTSVHLEKSQRWAHGSIHPSSWSFPQLWIIYTLWCLRADTSGPPKSSLGERAICNVIGTLRRPGSTRGSNKQLQGGYELWWDSNLSYFFRNACFHMLSFTVNFPMSRGKAFHFVSRFTQNCCVQAGAVFFSFQLVWVASCFARMVRHVCGMWYLFRRILYKSAGSSEAFDL